MRFDSGSAPSAREPFSDSESAYETGNPFANWIAGARLSAQDFLPYFETAISKPRTVPGTPEDRQPSILSLVRSPFASRYMSRDDLAGAISRKSMNVERPSAKRISMKPPPPRLPAN